MGQRILCRFFDGGPATVRFSQRVPQDLSQRVVAIRARLTGLGNAAFVDKGADSIPDFARHQLASSQEQELFDDQIECGERQHQQQEDDGRPDPAAGE